MSFQWGVAGNFPAIYEELMVPAFFRTFAEDLVSRVAPQPGDRLLDIATGTGIVIRVALEHEPALAAPTGLDRTAGMLDTARAVAGDLGATWLEGDALDLPFGPDSFDIVTCQQGLQFFPDRGAALAEMRRVLAPGGRVAVACWAPMAEQEAQRRFDASVRELEPDLAAVGQVPFSLGDPDELAGLVAGTGFEDVVVARVELPAHFTSGDAFYRSFAEGSPLALALAELPAERVAALRELTLRAVEPLVDASGMRAEMVTHLALGRTPSASA